jgi:hypothetical protein
MVKKGEINYILFIILFLLGLIQAVSGLLLWLVIPEGGYQGGRGIEASGSTFIWDRHTWINLHDWTAVALLVMVIIHLILHWKWIAHMTKKSVGIKS